MKMPSWSFRESIWSTRNERRFDARSVTLMHSNPGEYHFEETHWWLNQITRLGEEWLDDLFGDRRTYLDG